MRVLIDADTIVEILFNRSGIVEKVESLWSLLEEWQIEAYLSDIGVDKIRSFAERITDPVSAHEIVSTIQALLKICPVNEMILQDARSSVLEDYESAVEESCALAGDIGAIVTHKLSDFAGANLSILFVDELLDRQHLERQHLERQHVGGSDLATLLPSCGWEAIDSCDTNRDTGEVMPVLYILDLGASDYEVESFDICEEGVVLISGHGEDTFWMKE